MTKSPVEPGKNYNKRIMKNHTLKIENLPILTEELSHDELAAVKGGDALTISLLPFINGPALTTFVGPPSFLTATPGVDLIFSIGVGNTRVFGI